MSQGSFKHKLTTILSADVAGYSNLFLLSTYTFIVINDSKFYPLYSSVQLSIK